MSTRLAVTVSVVLVGLAFLAGILLYPQLPDPMPSHWNAAGEVDGYMSKFWGVFLVPIVSAGLVALLVAIPSIDPLRANIEQFRREYNVFVVGFVAYMDFVFALILWAGLGGTVNMSSALIPAAGLLFMMIGWMVGRARRNYFIGIRTPWTLDDEVVWDATHRLGARTFSVAGALMVLSAFLGSAGMWVLLGAILVAVVIPIVYSYVIWRRRHPAGSSRTDHPTGGGSR